MSIVHIISSLNIGGAENFVVQLANEKTKHKTVKIISLGKTNSNRNYIHAVNQKVELIELGWKKKYSVIQFYQLMILIKKLMPQVIHVHLHNPFYYVFGMSIFNRKPRYIHTLHSSFQNWKRVLTIVNKLRFLSSKILHVCLSNAIAKDIKSQYPRIHTTVIPNGIQSYRHARSKEDVKSFWKTFETRSENSFKFLAIGNISDNKNYKLLALTFEAIALKYPNVIGVQIGNPTDQKLSNELKEIGASNLFLVGPKENAADFLLETDALIISSIEEGMPIVALEALSMGVPIITTPAGGMVDVVNENNGIISRNFEVQEFKKTILKFLDMNFEKRMRLSKNAKVAFENNYEISITANLYKVNYGLD